MEIITANVNKPSKMQKGRFSLRNLRLSLKFRPEIMRLVLKMRHKIRKKTQLLNILKQRLENQSSSQTPNAFTQTENTTEDIVVSKIPTSYKEDESTDNHQNTKHQNASTQTDETSKLLDKSPITEQNTTKTNEVKENSNLEGAKELNVASDENGGWKLGNDNSESGKSIAEQVKEAAQSAMQQSGMVYMESAGMYYDYKTGYYYSSELGLYYHPETGCYYQYSEDKQTFEFHPYPDRSKTATNALYEAHEKKKARKLRKARQREEQDIENLTKNLSQGKEDDQGSKAKRRKKSSKKTENGDEKIEKKTDSDCKEEILEKEKASVDGEAIFDGADKEVKPQDLEEGECSESDHEKEDEKDVDEESVESDASVSTVSDDDDDSIAKHHPPSMRVIVRESNLTKLKVGSLFLVTKHGGTVGRQGSSHTILIEDTNVSRNHLDIKYDMSRRIYTITDLGSKNGTTLNGVRISESQIISEPVEVMHGSTLQLGETKLLCHIHPGIDTCGHCEPGLVMEKSAAIKILTRGVELDTKKRYTEALVCYQEGLQILVDKMKAFGYGTLKKVEEYMKRAETIKKLVLQQKEAGKFHEQVHIENNSTGHSYKSLFGRFLDDDVQYVVVEDPYIRSFHQCQNLLRLCELLVKTCCNLRHIKLVTSRGGKSEGGQRNWFHSLNEDLQKYRVNLAVEYSETLHDRQITLSSGWIIKIGRGLDFFKPPENKFCLGVYDMDLRQCHETTVDIVHSKNVKQSYG